MKGSRHFAGIGFVIATALLPRANAADETLAGLHGNAGLAVQGRALLRSGLVTDADRLVRREMELGADDALWCLAGEIRFRRADFDAARRAFQASTEANPRNARAWWGLGRIEQLHFNRAVARDLFAKAFRLDSSDPDILLSYLDFVENPQNRRILLRNLASFRESMPERAAWAVARLQIESHLAGRLPGELASAYTNYRLRLAGFHPGGATRHGLMVMARINRGRPLRLLLDTGARGILLHGSAARGLGLESVVESQVGGFGGSGASKSMLSLARSVAFDELSFRDCLVEVSAQDVTPGADGIVGASLFERFQVRIDAPSRILELTPGTLEGLPPATQVLGLDRLLLVRTKVPPGREGWFLLDTGAAFTAVAPSLTSAAQTRAGGVELVGMQGVAGAFRIAPMALQVGGRAVTEPEPVALDLAAISQREGVEISGILGFSTLSRWPVTIDFRTGSVRLGDAR